MKAATGDSEEMKLNPAQIKFLNALIEKNESLERELETLRLSVASSLYQLSIPLEHEIPV